MDFFNEFYTKELPAIIFRETITSDINDFKELAPSAGCVRHQFLNFMIKSSIRKFKLEPKANVTYAKSVEMLFEHHADEMSNYNPSIWRWDRY